MRTATAYSNLILVAWAAGKGFSMMKTEPSMAEAELVLVVVLLLFFPIQTRHRFDTAPTKTHPNLRQKRGYSQSRHGLPGAWLQEPSCSHLIFHHSCTHDTRFMHVHFKQATKWKEKTKVSWPNLNIQKWRLVFNPVKVRGLRSDRLLSWRLRTAT